ncbi:unnamed protein product [Rotaria sp. Silwood2]|nr:unnamed protein product [Rotaria sp. Silwood2]
MDFAVAKLYIEKYFDESARNQSMEIIVNVRNAFIDMVQQSSWMDPISKSKAIEKIPGLMAGCMPLDSMRQSTLECLYNQSCIDAISLQPNISQPKALNISLSKFPLNLTIGSLFDEFLFVETWKNQSSFENYFAACQPQSISYNYETRFHLGTIITMSLNAFGGLVIVWELITPVLILIWQRIPWKKQQYQPTATEEPTCVQLENVKTAPKTINKGE